MATEQKEGARPRRTPSHWIVCSLRPLWPLSWGQHEGQERCLAESGSMSWDLWLGQQPDSRTTFFWNEEEQPFPEHDDTIFTCFPHAQHLAPLQHQQEYCHNGQPQEDTWPGHYSKLLWPSSVGYVFEIIQYYNYNLIFAVFFSTKAECPFFLVIVDFSITEGTQSTDSRTTQGSTDGQPVEGLSKCYHSTSGT